jgi:toxin-antitoxin system PIN domain toxin
LALLDVNALVALAWDSHVHHVTIRRWFSEKADEGWESCPVTETGFIRVSSNPKVLPTPVGTGAALAVLASMRQAGSHRFLTDDVSPVDPDVPAVAGHRQITDAHLLTIARRHGVEVVTFDAGLAALADGDGVELLSAI